MTTATPTATPRTRNANAPRKAFSRVLHLWADALIALKRAESAADALAEALTTLLPDESAAIAGEDLRHDLWHTSYCLESQRSLIESNAPHSVTLRVEAAS